MKIRSMVLLVLALCVLGACGGPPPEPEEGLYAFVGARVIDGTGNPAMEDAVLVVRDGRIEAVGPRSSLPPPPTANQIDVTGKTIMPGMIDAHSHVGGHQRTRGQAGILYRREYP